MFRNNLAIIVNIYVISIKQLTFETEMQCVVCDVGIEFSFLLFSFAISLIFQAFQPQFMHTVHAYKVHFHQIKSF